MPEHDLIHNKLAGSECTGGHLFPDIRIDLVSHNIIIEIDEFQHRDANYDCDKRRMYDIIAKIGFLCAFIRYNPDNKLSDKEILLQTVKKYLSLNYNGIKTLFDNYGFIADYLFYK